ncbi:SUMF1/EgtB/PvdO family nonheme iron enzyme, partial [bacterium]|nr:SUMF1/EgtB/PvdO family nonheme iron enzyme [bacterium]
SVAGAVLGTLDFMPPEQRKDVTLTDSRSDLWSLAATLYQMVTGESPKVIRIKRVPQQIQDVLDKALEDSKDDRYQTAREFRDALRASQKGGVKPVPSAMVELGTGECPECHTQNQSSRKFCSECAAPLRVSCLKCEAEIPVWDKVCGECGGKQAELAAAKLEELVGQREQAEDYRRDYRFEQAIRIARSLAAVEDNRIAKHVPWAAEFVTATEADWDRERESADQHLSEAQTHHKAFDYKSAIHTLQSVPDAMRSSEISGYLRQLKSDQRESKELIATISDRVKRRDLPGLLEQVERALQLRGDRADLRILREQLQKQVSKSNLTDGSGNKVIRNSVGILLAPVRLDNTEITRTKTDRLVSAQQLLIGVFPITQQQYQHIMQSNPSRFKGENRPVETVTFHEAESFCRALSELPSEVSAGRRYRLPTESEWEHACRAGTQTTFSFGEDEISFWDGVDDAGQDIGGTDHTFFEYGWCKDNSDRQSHPVGLKQPNRWGLFDMHGNVWEWCTDNTLKSSDAWPVRGGSWQSTIEECSSVSTTALLPHISRSMVGFRIVCDIN